MTKEKTKAKGTLIIKKNGQVVRELKNLIVTTGLAAISGLLLSDTAGSYTPFDYCAIGTGTTSATTTDTTLKTESYRVAGTGTQITTTLTNDTAQLVTTFSITGTHAITESGIFNAASAGTMLNRATFAAINVVNGDEIEITWKVQFGSA